MILSIPSGQSPGVGVRGVQVHEDSFVGSFSYCKLTSGRAESKRISRVCLMPSVWAPWAGLRGRQCWPRLHEHRCRDVTRVTSTVPASRRAFTGSLFSLTLSLRFLLFSFPS